ncbi:MAG: hypothetical protein EHM61_27195 [Acidobacteria bacterium]|nr:MAG: hypothetical protein EHM61_27195 [Acidobacteriota bacterium]
MRLFWEYAWMANYLKMDKKEAVCALLKLGWPYRRIERETGVRRETGRPPAGPDLKISFAFNRLSDIRSQKAALEAIFGPFFAF